MPAGPRRRVGRRRKQGGGWREASAWRVSCCKAWQAYQKSASRRNATTRRPGPNAVILASLFRPPHAAAFLDGFQDLDGLDTVHRRGQRVAIEDDEVGEQAGFDATLALLLEDLPGGGGGERLQRFIGAQPLVGAADDA